LILLAPVNDEQLDMLGQLFEGQFKHACSLSKELKYDEVRKS
jgi:hypothetical protein